MLDRETLEAALEGLLQRQREVELRIQNVRELLEAASSDGIVGVKKRNLTPESRQRIVAAQKKRWAKFRKGQGD